MNVVNVENECEECENVVNEENQQNRGCLKIEAASFFGPEMPGRQTFQANKTMKKSEDV